MQKELFFKFESDSSSFNRMNIYKLSSGAFQVGMTLEDGTFCKLDYKKIN